MLHWACCAGSTLLIPSAPNDLKHLHVILNDPIDLRQMGYAPDSCLLVGVSTVPASAPFDNTCVLQPVDHTFLTSKSFVYYKYIRMERAGDLMAKAGSGFFVPKEPIDTVILQRLINGVQNSIHTPMWALDIPLF